MQVFLISLLEYKWHQHCVSLRYTAQWFATQTPWNDYHASLMNLINSRTCAQSCLTLCDRRDCSPPGSPVHGTAQAKILEWVDISFSRESSWPRDQTCGLLRLLHWQQILYHWATWEILHHQLIQTQNWRSRKKYIFLVMSPLRIYSLYNFMYNTQKC